MQLVHLKYAMPLLLRSVWVPEMVWMRSRLVTKLIVSPRYRPELLPLTRTRNSPAVSAKARLGSAASVAASCC